MKVPRCIECGRREAECVGGLAIYPHRPDLAHKWFWRCPCGAYVGCHPGSQNPLGSCAGPETRTARSRAHTVFDPIWKNRHMSRGEAYHALADEMGIPVKQCHISWMTTAEANLAAWAARQIHDRIGAAARPATRNGKSGTPRKINRMANEGLAKAAADVGGV